MRYLSAMAVVLAGIVSATSVAKADDNALLQAQLDQQASQLRMQQQLNAQSQSLNDRQLRLETQQDLGRVQLRYQLDSQNATMSRLLEQQELQLLDLQRSTKPLPPKLLKP